MTPASAVAAGFLIAVALLICVVPLLAGYDPYTQNLAAGLAAPLDAVDGRHYLLGTDFLGRDLLSRLALAGRVSVLIGVCAVAISLVLGVALGLLAGFFGGWLDNAVTGVADLQLAIPRVLLLIACAAVFGSSVVSLTLLLGITSWVSYGRIARAMALSLREREFVLSAITQGAGSLWNIRRHLLPNVAPQMLILGSFELGQVISLEASMSYLGLGVQPPLPSWGMMISEGQDYLALSPMLSIAPGVAIFLLVAGVQILTRHITQEGAGGLAAAWHIAA